MGRQKQELRLFQKAATIAWVSIGGATLSNIDRSYCKEVKQMCAMFFTEGINLDNNIFFAAKKFRAPQRAPH
ncbi:hypothetical protein R6Q59_025061 [Mikania micrantha]